MRNKVAKQLRRDALALRHTGRVHRSVFVNVPTEVVIAPGNPQHGRKKSVRHMPVAFWTGEKRAYRLLKREAMGKGTPAAGRWFWEAAAKRLFLRDSIERVAATQARR